MDVGRLKSFTFKASKNTVIPQKTETKTQLSVSEQKSNNAEVYAQDPYNDPLMKWPVRGLAYTNEIGVAIQEVAPALGVAMWIPALMYIGADIYDKYKNDNTQYNPCAQRGLKQAVFQGLASVSMPTCAVLAGQKLFSLFGYMTKGRLSINSKEKISNYAVDFIESGHLAKYAGRDDECKESFQKGLTNVLNFKKHEKQIQGTKNKIIEFLKSPSKFFAINPSAASAQNYGQTSIESLIALRKELTGETDKTLKNLKWHTTVDKSVLKGVSRETAIRSTLVKFQKSKITRGKWFKTAGGFAALALAAKPIDQFVECVILPKYVSPGLNKLGIKGSGTNKTAKPETSTEINSAPGKNLTLKMTLPVNSVINTSTVDNTPKTNISLPEKESLTGEQKNYETLVTKGMLTT